MQSEATATLESTAAVYTRNNPYSATVLENRLLTGSGSEKETRHIELDLADSGIEYLPGDSAGILPVNTCDAVDLVLERLQFTGDELVTDFYGKPLDLRQALTSWLMIGKLSSSTLKAWAKHTGNPGLSALIEPGNREKLDAYLWGREFLDLLEHAPANLTTRSSSSSCFRVSRRVSTPSPPARPSSARRSTSPSASSNMRVTAATALASAPRTSASALHAAASSPSSFTPTSSSACPPSPMSASSW